MNKEFIEAPKKAYAEIYQDSDLHFAMALEDDTSIRQVHSWIKCRDFLNEALVASQIGGIDSPTIWSFSYPAKKYPMDLKTTRMLLKGNDFSIFYKNIKLLQDYEKGLGVIESQVSQINDTPYLYITSSDIWMRSTVMVSLFTHILRILYSYESDKIDLIGFMRYVGEKCKGNAATYQKSLNEIPFHLLLEKVDELFPAGILPEPGMESINNVGHIHNNTGIVSWSKTVSGGGNIMGTSYKAAVETFKQYMD